LNKSIPQFSIIIPVYHTEKYLAACLDSVIFQTLHDIQIIVVNDASPDKSHIILDEYAAKDARIEIVNHSENLGLVQARLSGLSKAQGEYIIFLDSDDIIDIHLCELAYAHASVHQADIVQFGTQILTELDKESVAFKNLEQRLLPLDQTLTGLDIFDYFFVKKAYSFSLWAKVFHKSIWEHAAVELEANAITMGEDLYLYTYASLKAKKFISFPDKFYHYRFGTGISSVGYASENKNITSIDQWIKYLSVQTACDQVKNLLKLNNLLEQYYDAWLYWQKLFFNACCYNFLLVSIPLKVSAFTLLADAWGSLPVAQQLLLNAYDDPDFFLWLHNWWLQLLKDTISAEKISQRYSYQEITRLLPLVIHKHAEDVAAHKKMVQEAADHQIQKIKDQFYNSLSWRVTKPLRFIFHVMCKTLALIRG
jgi:glycosyltransferase involved in cell wall biosynthesis